MTRLTLGILLGIAVGVIDVLLMLPMKFPNKQTALPGAFSSRFAIGFLAANVTLPLPAIAAGALVGPLISIPDAILTPALQFGNICRWQRSHRRDLPLNPAMALCDKPRGSEKCVVTRASV